MTSFKFYLLSSLWILILINLSVSKSNTMIALDRLYDEAGKTLNLSKMDLTSKQLEQWNHLLRDFAKHYTLEHLNLENNNLEYIPLHIALLPNLKTVNVQNNPLKIIPQKRTTRSGRNFMESEEMLDHALNIFCPPDQEGSISGYKIIKTRKGKREIIVLPPEYQSQCREIKISKNTTLFIFLPHKNRHNNEKWRAFSKKAFIVFAGILYVGSMILNAYKCTCSG